MENNTTLSTFSDLSVMAQTRCLYSDMFKDTYGFRPRNFSHLTVEEMEAEMDRMQPILAEMMAEHRDAQAKCVVVFENKIKELIATGAGDRATAIRWLNTENDIYFMEYEFNLPYGYLVNGI